MRSLIAIVLAVFAGAATAKVAIIENDAGGKIVLTGEASTGCGDGRRIAYASGDRHRTIFGCWFADEIMVHVEWEDGDIRSYPVEDFQFRGD